MTKLILQFLNAKSNQEITRLVNDHLEILNENPKLFTFVKNARKRVNRIRKEKMKSWKTFEMN